jgi:hypothetical protein
MKPETKKLKNARGRITGYRATLGDGLIVCDAPTPAEAVADCERFCVDALQRLARGTTVRRWRGHVFVVMPTLGGYAYWLDTFPDTYTVSRGRETHEEAYGAALHHLAQNLWEHDEDDAAFVADLPPRVRTDVEHWIRFQRAYKVERDRGRSDVDAHRLACEAASAVQP